MTLPIFLVCFMLQFVEPADAEEAKYHMDGQILMGRQMTVVFAEENRKKPSDMRLRERRLTADLAVIVGGHPPHYFRSPRLRGPHLVAIPDHHVPAVITLLHPEEGTTQGPQDFPSDNATDADITKCNYVCLSS
ncbi:serine/arginine-rich SC35-like splicing factor SCL30A [Tanacetum coccineum]